VIGERVFRSPITWVVPLARHPGGDIRRRSTDSVFVIVPENRCLSSSR
jgi:hypothetical protein